MGAPSSNGSCQPIFRIPHWFDVLLALRILGRVGERHRVGLHGLPFLSAEHCADSRSIYGMAQDATFLGIPWVPSGETL